MELWKVINDYENYEISTLGRVRNNNKIINLQNGSKDYLIVTLYNKPKQKTFRVHRLVAIHFLPNFYGKPTVDHKNRNRKDNRLVNLRWATWEEQHSNRVPNNNKGGYIRFSKNHYSFHYCIDGIQYCRIFKTLEEAQEAQQQYIENGFTIDLPKKSNNKGGYIYKTKYNTYRFYYYLNKKRINKTFKTLEEAQEAQREYITKFLDDEFLPF